MEKILITGYAVPIKKMKTAVDLPVTKKKIAIEIPFLYKNSIIKWLRNIEPNLVYTRCSSSWIGIAEDYARKNRICHVHAITSDNVAKTRFDIASLLNPIRFVEVFYIKRGLKLASYIVTQNHYQNDLLQKRFGIHGITKLTQ